jgi:hypothetical protein
MMRAYQRGVTAPIAGIAVVSIAADGLALRPEVPPVWPGSRETDEPVTIHHVIGDSTPAGMREVLEPSPTSTYYLDAGGNVAVQFRSAAPHRPNVLMRTVKPGSEYEVRYPFAPRFVTGRARWDFSAIAFALGHRRRGFFVHSCGFLLPTGEGIVCPGVSGTGKTTLTLLLRDLDTGLELLSDDRTIVTRENGDVRLWGSPFPGEARISGRGDGPLRAIVFPRHASAMKMRSVTARDAARRLRDTLALPLWDGEQLADSLDLLDRLVSNTVLVEASYPATTDAARWLIDSITSRLT